LGFGGQGLLAFGVWDWEGADVGIALVHTHVSLTTNPLNRCSRPSSEIQNLDPEPPTLKTKTKNSPEME
jgi:hypothetical protein